MAYSLISVIAGTSLIGLAVFASQEFFDNINLKKQNGLEALGQLIWLGLLVFGGMELISYGVEGKYIKFTYYLTENW